jgi:hypothetical protein
MSDKIKRVTPREIAEMIWTEQAYADPRFVLAEAHDAEIERLRAEIERQRAHKEALYVRIVLIERAAAGAIYSQEMIHAMALDALKSLEVKP